MTRVNITEFEGPIAELIKQAINGEEIIIASGNQPVAKLIGLKPHKKTRKLGSAKGLFNISDDFGEPLEEFSEYMT